VEHPAPVTSSTLFQVASITKTFTSAAVGLLVDEGAVAFEDPVSRHLPALGAATGLDLDTITVEHLLSHQAGFDGDHLFVSRVATSRTPLLEGLAALSDARRLFPPGTGYSYNNAAFSMAGAIVQVVSGQPYEAFVRERLLRPLGMVSASFTADEAITNPVALPHWVAEGTAHLIRGAGWQAGWELGPVDLPAGGLAASVEHLLAWCRFQWTGSTDDGDRLISQEVLRRLHTPVIDVTAVERAGLDWEAFTTDGVTAIGHGGVTAGYVSNFAVVPPLQVGVVTLTNATNGAHVHQAVRRWALERTTGAQFADPSPDPGLSIDAERLRGRYLHAFSVLEVEVGQAPGTVLITPSVREVEGWQPPIDPPTTCGFFSPADTVTLDAPGPAHVVRFDPDNEQAQWLHWAGRRAVRIT
jgi:CubicO group peptidase (beta-lactamase class C family)